MNLNVYKIFNEKYVMKTNMIQNKQLKIPALKNVKVFQWFIMDSISAKRSAPPPYFILNLVLFHPLYLFFRPGVWKFFKSRSNGYVPLENKDKENFLQRQAVKVSLL